MNLHSKIAIVSIFSDLNSSNYELYTIQNYKFYANLQNYALFLHKIPLNLDLASKSEYKYQAIAKCLQQQYKYVVWLDLNTIFNNPMYCLTKLITPNKNYDIILSNTTPNLLFYSSIIIFKNTEWVKNTINKTLNTQIKNNKLDYNHVIFNVINNKNQKDINSKLKIMDKKDINPLPGRNTIKDSYILEVNGLPLNTMIKFIQYTNEKIGT